MARITTMKKIFTLAFFCFFLIEANAQTLTSSNLPLIVINTNGQTIVDEPKIMADMGIIHNGPGVSNNITDPFNHYNGKIGIEIRGQISQFFPMKSYGFELWDNSGNSVNKSLFGLPSESDWILYAPYDDVSLMRNFMAYTMSREMGHWAANCRYVELVVNGDYKGIYVFMEKIKRNAGRVNISKLNTTDIAGDALTGGYIFSIDKQADAWYSSYVPYKRINNQTIRYSYVYPKISSIVTEQKAYIKSYVDSFETALNGPQYQDRRTGWRKFADENSFIDYFIVNEVMKNLDGYRLSSYFYKDKQSKGGKIIAGPVWDFNYSIANATYCNGGDVKSWSYRFNDSCPEDFWLVPFWWERFMTDTAFEGNLRCRWKQLRQLTLSQSHLYAIVDSISILTGEARQRHFIRWPNQYNNHEGDVIDIKAWIQNRLKWMDENIPNIGACFDYPANVKKSVIIKTFPNPFQKKLTIRIDSRNNQPLYINIFDGTGRQLIADMLNLTAGRNAYEYVTDGWAAGMYLLYYKSGNGETGTIKLIKQ